MLSSCRATTLQRRAGLLLASLTLTVLSALVTGRPDPYVRGALQILFGTILFLFGRFLRGRRLLRPLLLGGAVLFSLTTALAGLGLFSFWGGGPQRVAVFTGNANLLGASIATLTLAALAPRAAAGCRPFRLVGLLSGAAGVVVAGSRLAAVSLAGGAALMLVPHLVSQPVGRLARRGGFVVVASLLLGGLITLGGPGPNVRRVNILRATNALSSTYWSTRYASDASLRRTSGLGVAGLLRPAFRLAGTAAEARTLILFQPVGTSEAREPYVASAEFRAPKPGTLVLSTQLSSSICHYTTEWTRCATPPGIGDGHLQVQFRIESVRPGGHVDVQVRAPQVEVGTAATRFHPVLLPLVPAASRQHLAEILSPGKLLLSLRERLSAFGVAIHAFLDSPLFGVGQERMLQRLNGGAESASVPRLFHAHNLVLQVLGEGGVAWAAALTLALLAAWPQTGCSAYINLYPLLFALVVLNSFDLTLFYSLVFIPSCLLLGAASLVTPSTCLRNASDPNRPRGQCS